MVFSWGEKRSTAASRMNLQPMSRHRSAQGSGAGARPASRCAAAAPAERAFGKQRDHLGVQGVGLGEATERPGAIPDLTRVDDRERQLGAAQRRGDGDLEAADLESRRMI